MCWCTGRCDVSHWSPCRKLTETLTGALVDVGAALLVVLQREALEALALVPEYSNLNFAPKFCKSSKI